MSRSHGKLRLGPLPRNESIKLSVSLPVDLKQALDDYASAYGQVYGESVDAATLVPHMLQAFIARDRGFKAMGKKRPSSLPAAPAAS